MKNKFFEKSVGIAVINPVQQYKISEWISAIYQFNFDMKGINSEVIANAFTAMMTDEVSDDDKQIFIEQGVWDSIESVRHIFSHSSPQDALNLTQYNDKKAPAITKEGVVSHLRDIIGEQISIMSLYNCTN